MAQLPLLAALAVVVVASTRTTERLGVTFRAVLQDNFRSVLAIQQIKDSVEALDDDARNGAVTDPGQLGRVEEELQVQEANVTEEGEAEATRALRQAWTSYRVLWIRYLDTPKPRGPYPPELHTRLTQLRTAAGEVLALNLDAMVRKNDQSQHVVGRSRGLLLFVALLALALGLIASLSWTRRLLRPLRVVGQAVQRMGQGDLDARIRLQGHDEVAALAHEFNQMADRLGRLRRNSLGELLQAHASTQATLDALEEPVVVFGAEGSVLNVSQYAERLLGLSIDKPRAGLDGAAPEVRDTIDRLMTHVFSGKGAYTPRGLEEALRLATPEGERFLLPRAAPVYTPEGGVEGATVVLQDVTRMWLFNELQNDVVATVAHEFRTPLTSLRMAIHLCLEEMAGPLTEKQKDLLQAGRVDCERLQAMVDDLLHSARLQAGQASLTRSVRPVPELLSEVMSQHHRAAEERKVQLRMQPPPEGLFVEVDPERTGLVFNNVVGNALAHTPEGGEVTLGVRREAAWVRFEVKDSGPGIPPEYQPRVFEKFFQIPGRSSTGAGLGLYIAREVVLAHGGNMGVESAGDSRGSVFWFTLPRAEAVRTA
jgi:signal transduction histidine kinase